LEKDREERGQADELAGAMNEFFAALYVQDIVAGFDNRGPSNELLGVGGSGSEFPLASPDSITVTTEFGVMEESGTVTVISASGPSPHHQAYDDDTEDDNNVEMTEDLNHDIPELQISLSPLQLTAQASVVDPEIEHMQDASDDEADVDTDGFDADADVDAESAFIEEFIYDEGHYVLTPTGIANT
jgi:hypothetical protein